MITAIAAQKKRVRASPLKREPVYDAIYDPPNFMAALKARGCLFFPVWMIRCSFSKLLGIPYCPEKNLERIKNATPLSVKLYVH